MTNIRLEQFVQRWLDVPWILPSNGMVLTDLHISAGCCRELEATNLPDQAFPDFSAKLDDHFDSGGRTFSQNRLSLFDRYMLREFGVERYREFEKELTSNKRLAWHGKSSSGFFHFESLEKAVLFHLIGLMNLRIPIWSRSGCDEFQPIFSGDGNLLAWHPVLLLPTITGFSMRNVVLNAGTELAVPHVALRGTFGLLPELENFSQIVAVRPEDLWPRWFGANEVLMVNLGNPAQCRRERQSQVLIRSLLSNLLVMTETLKRRLPISLGRTGITSFLSKLLGAHRPFMVPFVLPPELRGLLLHSRVLRGEVI